MPEFIPIALLIFAAGFLLFVALLAFLLTLRGVLTIAYNGDIAVDYRVLFFKIPIYPPPKPKKKKRRKWHMSAKEAARIKKQQEKKDARLKSIISRFKPKKKEKKEEDEPSEKPSHKKPSLPTKEDIKNTLTDAVDVTAAVTEIIAVVVKRFTHHLKIKVARFKIKIATEDAAVTAVTYGAVSQIINVLLPILATVKNFDLPKEKNFDISADFSTTETEIDIKVSFSLRIWHFADMGIRSLWGGIDKLFSRRKNAKYPIPFLNKSIAEILESFNKEEPPDESTSKISKKAKN